MSHFGRLNPANTPGEMRKALVDISYDNTQVRQILDFAKYEGLSGEDTYVILAYSLLKENILFKENLMNEMMLRPPESIIFKKDKP